MYQSYFNIDNLTITVNQELDKMYNWLYANKLCLNVNTTQHCVCNPNNSNYELKSSAKINNGVINQIGKYNKDDISRNLKRALRIIIKKDIGVLRTSYLCIHKLKILDVFKLH